MAEQSLTGGQLIFILLFFLLLLGFWEGMLSTGRMEEMQEQWWLLPPPTPDPGSGSAAELTLRLQVPGEDRGDGQGSSFLQAGESGWETGETVLISSWPSPSLAQ